MSARVYLRFSFDFYVSKTMHLSRGSNGYARIDVRFSDKNDKSVQIRLKTSVRDRFTEEMMVRITFFASFFLVTEYFRNNSLHSSITNYI